VKILAIDPATICGVADSNGLRRIWNLNAMAPPGHEGARHLALARKLREVLIDGHYDLLVVEKAAFGAIGQLKTAAFHSSLAGVIVCVAAELQVPVWWANPSEIKKFATGFGNAKKEDMITAAKRAGELIRDDNVADAYWVLKWAEKEVRIKKLCKTK
jgi:Holliday junction resolvasome RuvABC endonuclease subunit